MGTRRESIKAGAKQLVEAGIGAASGAIKGGAPGALRGVAAATVKPVVHATIGGVQAGLAIRGARKAEKVAAETEKRLVQKRKEHAAKKRKK